MNELAPDILLAAYAEGIFPMADENQELFWLSPDPRAILPLEGFHASRNLMKKYRNGPYEFAIDRAFERVIERCGDRCEGTWISDDIREAFTRLHHLGFAHSVETWCGGRLIGGLYGVSMGGVFWGESMFFHETDGSKLALVHLVRRMVERKMTLLDVQFTTGHLKRFGVAEIPQAEYLTRLKNALSISTDFAD